MKIASIDIGTNAVKSKVFNTTPTSIDFIEGIRSPIRLGAEVFNSGKLSDQKLNELSKTLKKYQKIFIKDDILENNLAFLESGIYRIAGNLPYNISTQIILKMIHHFNIVKDMHFLVQKEVAEKIAGSPGTKDWGKMSIKLAAFFKTEILFDVPPEAFDIKPKVNSSFIRMTPLEKTRIKNDQIKDFFEIIDLSFSSRRKNIKNNLKKQNFDWDNLDIDFNLRPEELSLSNYVELAKAFKE